MNFWLKAILLLIVQESFLTNLLIKETYQDHYNVYIFTGIFLLASIIDTLIGYSLGKYVQRRGLEHKIISWTNNYISKFDDYIGKFGEKIFILFLALTFPPYFPAFLSSWLKISLKEIFIIILIGDIIWYITSWGLVIGITHWVKDSQKALYLILFITFIIIILKNIASRKFYRKK